MKARKCRPSNICNILMKDFSFFTWKNSIHSHFFFKYPCWQSHWNHNIIHLLFLFWCPKIFILIKHHHLHLSLLDILLSFTFPFFNWFSSHFSLHSFWRLSLWEGGGGGIVGIRARIKRKVRWASSIHWPNDNEKKISLCLFLFLISYLSWDH